MIHQRKPATGDPQPVSQSPTDHNTNDHTLSQSAWLHPLFDLSRQWSFYHRYHKNPTNVLLHIVGVPIILITIVCLFNYIPVPRVYTFDSGRGDASQVVKVIWDYRKGLEHHHRGLMELLLPPFYKEQVRRKVHEEAAAAGTANTSGFVFRPTSSSLLTPSWSMLPPLLYLTYYVILDVPAGVATIPFLLMVWIGANGIFFHFGYKYAWMVSLVLNAAAWVMQFIGHGVYEGTRPALLDNLVQAFLTAPIFVYLELLFNIGFFPKLRRRLILANLSVQQSQ